MIKAKFSYGEDGKPTMELTATGQDEAFMVKILKAFKETNLPTTEHNYNIIGEDLKGRND